MAKRNQGLPDEQRIDVRMGINLGDVIVEGEDRHGDAVNVAAQLQQVAEPGGICVSRAVMEHVKQKVALSRVTNCFVVTWGSSTCRWAADCS